MEESYSSTISSSDSEFWDELQQVTHIQTPDIDAPRFKTALTTHKYDLYGKDIPSERKAYGQPVLKPADSYSLREGFSSQSISEAIDRMRKAKDQELNSLSIKVRNQTKVYHI